MTSVPVVVAYEYGRLSYNFAFLSYGFRVLSYSFHFLSYESKYLPTLIKRKVHLLWKAVRAGGGLPSGRQCRPIHSISWVTLKGEVLSDDFGRLSYDFAFLSYSFRVLSYGFRFLSDESTMSPALSKRKLHSIGKQSALAADCPVGGSCRPIHSISGLTLKGEILSDGFGRLSYDFTFLSYGFRVLSYGFHFLSDEPQFPSTLIERKGHLIGKQPASRTAQWAAVAARSIQLVG